MPIIEFNKAVHNFVTTKSKGYKK